MEPDADPLLAYARRANLERNLYVAECIASAILAVHIFVQRVAGKACAPRVAKRAAMPVTQR